MSPTKIKSHLLHGRPALIVITSLFFLNCSPKGSLASHTAVEILPSLSLDTTGSEVTVSDIASYNVTCSSPANTMSTLTWHRVVNSVPTPVTDGTTDTSTNVTTNMMLTITSNSLTEGSTVEYFCVATNNIGAARTRSLRVRSAFFGGFSSSLNVSNVTVRITHAVAINCGVLPSSPLPTITWRMNNVVISETIWPTLKYRFLDDGQYLVIYSLENSDVVGVDYRCEVTNVNGSLTVESPTVYNLVVVAMFAAPGFMAYRPPQNVVFSDLSESITRYYIGATNGLVGQLILNEFPETNDQSHGNLSVTYLGTTLAGATDNLFAITLQDGATSINPSRVDANITLLDAIVVQSTVPSGIIDGFTGERFSFNCTATGTGIQFAWYKNGTTLVPSSGGTTHTITSATPTDNGVYQCHWYSQQLGTFLTNTWGLVIADPVRPIVPIYQSSPVETEPSKTIVTRGMPVTLQLEVRADTLPTITWRVNATAISVNDTNYNISNITKEGRGDDHFFMSNITILMVNEATIGDYSAVIDDTRTNPVTTPNQLVSFPLPPTSVSLTSSLGCLLNGMVVRLTCVSDGLPTPVITFVKNLIPITCNPGSSCNISNNVLTFEQPMQSDGDRYSCLATNSLMGSQVGEQRSPVKELAYCTRPAISNITGPVTFTSGQSSTAILTCTVSGLPIADVMVNWTFNMETLRTSEKYSMAVAANSNHQLTILNINTDDTGTYRCTVFHRLLSNTETRTVQVTVLGPEGVDLPVWSYPLMALAGVVVILLLIAVVFLAVLCCCYSDRRGGYTPGGKAIEATDGRGNVDQDSDEEERREEPEEFRPQYESLPALRPALPPQYKPSPAYNQQFGDDMEMVKVPPPETDSTAFEFQPYQQQDNGSVVGSGVGGDGYPAQQARFDDFMSDDGQFV